MKMVLITDQGAIAEGIEQLHSGYWSGGMHKVKGTPKHLPSAREAYFDLWDSINGEGSCKLNPYIWVVGIKKTIKEELNNETDLQELPV